jgi:hypothetical protein
MAKSEKKNRNPARSRDVNVSVLFTKTRIPDTINPRIAVKKIRKK